MDITINSNLADNIIAVVEAICDKFGIVFDWSAENILPKIQSLIARFAIYRVWMFASVFCFFLVIFIISMIVLSKTKKYSGLNDIAIIVSIFSFIITISLGIICAIHIPRCLNFPELELYDWAKNSGFLK